MVKIILTGVDDSETAFKAAKKAAALADAFGAELHVMSAFTVNTVSALRSLQRSHEYEHVSAAYREVAYQKADEARNIALAVAEKLKPDFPELKLTCRNVEGEPGEALVREAANIDADIIVVGNKRVQGPARILGSIARTVASEASCDLHVVHTQ